MGLEELEEDALTHTHLSTISSHGSAEARPTRSTGSSRISHALASALTEVRSGATTDEESDVMSPGTLKVFNFSIHAMVYSVPSLLPFVASAYPKHVEQQVMLWMLVSQQWGETIGRVMAPVSGTRLLPGL